MVDLWVGIIYIYIYPISPSTSFIIVVVTTTIPESSTSRQQPPIPDQSRACFSDSTPTGSYFVFAFSLFSRFLPFSPFSRFRVACPCITGGRDTRFVCAAHKQGPRKRSPYVEAFTNPMWKPWPVPRGGLHGSRPRSHVEAVTGPTWRPWPVT